MTDATSSPTPAEAWREMQFGNERFVRGEPQHPHQDAERRQLLATVQRPDVALFGCSDSRLAAEIIFDKGIGDLFVVRNAGQVISSSVIGSLEYAVTVLRVPLIVVLGHDSCGAVLAAVESQREDATPLPRHIRDLIAGIVPAVRRVAGAPGAMTGVSLDLQADDLEAIDVDALDIAEVGREHLRDTVAELLRESELISDAVAAGTLAIVGANYRLLEGRAVPDILIGDL